MGFRAVVLNFYSGDLTVGERRHQPVYVLDQSIVIPGLQKILERLDGRNDVDRSRIRSLEYKQERILRYEWPFPRFPQFLVNFFTIAQPNEFNRQFLFRPVACEKT